MAGCAVASDVGAGEGYVRAEDGHDNGGKEQQENTAFHDDCRPALAGFPVVRSLLNEWRHVRTSSSQRSGIRHNQSCPAVRLTRHEGKCASGRTGSCQSRMVVGVDTGPWKRFCSGKKARGDGPRMLILRFCFWTYLFPASVTESSNRVLGRLV